MSVTPVRGQIYWADLGFGPKPWLIVSNNLRNRKLRDVLAVRITTTDKHADLPTWVRLEPGDPLVGHVNTDDLQQLGREELGELAGCLRPATLLRINEALRIVLGLP
ncbi:type II toxin-antitoxin system PemK/MazF family toxin [Actinophytocola gossypii]|uniref:Type II toxin-antitoxin system PemK/MazF family toxin n=1 Tax=Actinophytocola gossypii TaxID=2812003 RepID=A0ABT2J478_9PSEU|nr:type II toxin-antitoxin system PemK/MazF family toxin [Actinophytocola gossypii]MCT2582674.1 type II toxin-antitoxin system PemK/MazF family toxin [Actinophytocola gossypii]